MIHCLQGMDVLLCYAIIGLTLIGLKQPLVTNQSQTKEARHANPICSCPITGQGSQKCNPSMQLHNQMTNHKPQKSDMLSQHV